MATRAERVDAYNAGKAAAKRGESLDEVPSNYSDELADEWERGWYAVMDA